MHLNKKARNVTEKKSPPPPYQCFPTPLQTMMICLGIHNIIPPLFSGTPLTLEAVSPSTIILSPPEKLVLEVRATGQYNFIVWTRNGDQVSTSGFPVSNTDNFAHFSEIYVNDMTTMDDLGVYDVQLPGGASSISAADTVEFIVIAPGNNYLSFIDISCTL